MTWLRGIPLTVCLGLALLPIALAAADAPVDAEPPGLRAYVEGVLKDLVASELKLTLFQDAAVDTVEKHDTPAGIPRYTCGLKKAKGKAGYVAVAETKGGFRVVSVSASMLSPEPFLSELNLGSLVAELPDFSQARLRHFANAVPLVAAGSGKMAGNQPFDLSDFACTLAVHFLYLQYVKGIPLVGGGFMQVATSQSFPVVFRGFHHQEGISLEDIAKKKRQAQAKGWCPVDEDIKNTLAQKAILLRRGTTEKVQGVDVAMGVIASHLVGPEASIELGDCLLAEENMIVALEAKMANGGLLSAGGRASLLLGRYYLGKCETVDNAKKIIDGFLKTRCVGATVTVAPLSSAEHGENPPCVILPKDARKGVVGLCLGAGTLGQSAFLLVFVPTTDVGKVWSLTEKREALGHSRVYPPKIQEYNNHLLINEDTVAEWPSSLGMGVHLVPTCVLSDWSVVGFTGWNSALARD